MNSSSRPNPFVRCIDRADHPATRHRLNPVSEFYAISRTDPTRSPLPRAFSYTVPYSRIFLSKFRSTLRARSDGESAKIVRNFQPFRWRTTDGKFDLISFSRRFSVQLECLAFALKFAKISFLFSFFSFSLLMNFRLCRKSWSSSRTHRAEIESGNPTAFGILLSGSYYRVSSGSSFKQRELTAANIRTNINNSFFLR